MAFFNQCEPAFFASSCFPGIQSAYLCFLSNREPDEARLVHPVADLWIGQRKHSSVPARGQSVDPVPARSKPQSPVQVQPAHVPQPPGLGAPFICRSTDSRQPWLPTLGHWSPLPAPFTPPEAFWPHTSSDSLGGQHHDPARHSPNAAKEQSKGPGNATSAQPQAHSSAAGLHCTAPQQIPRVPAGEPLGGHTDTKVSVALFKQFWSPWYTCKHKDPNSKHRIWSGELCAFYPFLKMFDNVMYI